MDLERVDLRSNGGNDPDVDLIGDEDAEVNLVGGNRVDDKNKKEKKRRPVKTLKIEDLLNRETGMKALYDTIRKNEPKLTKKAQTQPEKALEDYLSTIKEWAFSVAPKYEFNYFIDRCQTYGHKREFTEELNKLRKCHKGELIFNPETKDYEEATRQNRRVLITAEEPRPGKEYVDEPRRVLLSSDYDPLRDPDRALETFVDRDDLEYSIKKKAKVNSEGMDSPSVKVDHSMNIENSNS